MSEQLNEYTFDIPAVTTVRLLAETDEEARSKAAGLRSMQPDRRMDEDGTAWTSGRPEPTKYDELDTVAWRGEPCLVRAEGPVTFNRLGEKVRSGRSVVEVQPDPSLDLDELIRLGRRLAAYRQEAAKLLEQWEKAAGDDGSNDEEHECGFEMSELLTYLITDQWIVRYTWPVSDANPHGETRVHEDACADESHARMAAQSWREVQGTYGLKVDAEAVLI